MSDKKRPYRMSKRADLEQQTRLRITQSAIELHGTLGPSRTSISAIAEHAGVRRSTVYRHFPDEAALFNACSSHWQAAKPLPKLEHWAAIACVNERLLTALQELYAFYRRTERMMTNVHRDEETMSMVKQLMRVYRQYLADAGETLIKGWRLRRFAQRRVRAAIGFALAFPVWRSLAVEQKLNDAECAEFMFILVKTAQTKTKPAAIGHVQRSVRIPAALTAGA